MECKYCKKVLSTKSSLKTHQNTAKYCLKIQGMESKQVFECKLCNKTFTLKQTYQRHKISCNKSKNFENIQQKNVQLKNQLVNAHNENSKLLCRIEEMETR